MLHSLYTALATGWHHSQMALADVAEPRSCRPCSGLQSACTVDYTPLQCEPGPGHSIPVGVYQDAHGQQLCERCRPRLLHHRVPR